MLQINVFFKPNGKVLIDREIVGVHAGESILWQFHSVDPKVEWADVSFGNFEFFEDRGGGRLSRRYTDVRHGHASVIGTAPRLAPGPASTTSTASPSRRTSIDKYSVRGYSTQNDALASKSFVSQLDPEVIICDP